MLIKEIKSNIREDYSIQRLYKNILKFPMIKDDFDNYTCFKKVYYN